MPRLSRTLAAIITPGLLLLSTAQAVDMGDMMSPSRWMGDDDDRDRERGRDRNWDRGDYPPGPGGRLGGSGPPPGYDAPDQGGSSGYGPPPYASEAGPGPMPGYGPRPGYGPPSRGPYPGAGNGSLVPLNPGAGATGAPWVPPGGYGPPGQQRGYDGPPGYGGGPGYGPGTGSYGPGSGYAPGYGGPGYGPGSRPGYSGPGYDERRDNDGGTGPMRMMPNPMKMFGSDKN